MGALTSWYETNVDRGALGANGGFNAATGLTEPATAGTQRAFSKALLDTTMQQVYHSGDDEICGVFTLRQIGVHHLHVRS